MSHSGTKSGGGDEPDKYREEADAKSTAVTSMHTKLRIAFRGAEFEANQSRGRMAELAKRPNKDRSQNEAPLDATPDALRGIHQTTSTTRTDTGDTDDGEGDGGDTGKTGSGSGGGLAPDLDLTTSDYAPFAEAAEGASRKNDKAEAKKAAQQQTFKVDTAEGTHKAKAKVAAPKASGPKAGSPSGPGKGGGKGGGAPGPGGP